MRRPLTDVALPPAPHILVVMMSALGDVVHALPVVSALKRHDPATRITWVLQPGPASMIRGHPDVDEILVFRRGAGWRAYPELRRQLAGRSWDLVLDLQVYFKASAVTAMARAPVKLGFDRARARDLNWLVTSRRIPPHPLQHVQDQYLEFLDALGVDPRPLEWKLGPWAHELPAQAAFFAGLDRPAATLVIGSSDPRREWPAARWTALADALAGDYGLRPVLAGGTAPGEMETAREILRRARHPVVSTMGVPLRELVGILEGSALVVALDTGPMHMAVALGTPTVALVGFLNPKRTGPYRFRDLLVDAYGDRGEDYPVSQEKRPGRVARITVEDVLEKVELCRRRYGEREEA
jgi:heptosyltransferase I